MVIGFIGDMHGRAFHALGALLTWQIMRGGPFDIVVQVGDLGVLPNLETREIPYDRFSLWDPSVYDLCHIVLNRGEVPQLMERVRAHLPGPILAVTGNHDEFAPARNSSDAEPFASAALDPYDVFACVPDGFTVEVGDETVGFCGGGDLSPLERNGSPHLDVLITHEGGFGIGAEKDELAVGSDALLEYLKVRKPRYHVFGHFHHPVGPRAVYATQCIQLSSVVSDPRKPILPVMNEGGLGALDTEAGTFEFLNEPWLCDYTRQNGYRKLSAVVESLS